MKFRVSPLTCPISGIELPVGTPLRLRDLACRFCYATAPAKEQSDGSHPVERLPPIFRSALAATPATLSLSPQAFVPRFAGSRFNRIGQLLRDSYLPGLPLPIHRTLPHAPGEDPRLDQRYCYCLAVGSICCASPLGLPRLAGSGFGGQRFQKSSPTTPQISSPTDTPPHHSIQNPASCA